MERHVTFMHIHYEGYWKLLENENHFEMRTIENAMAYSRWIGCNSAMHKLTVTYGGLFGCMGKFDLKRGIFHCFSSRYFLGFRH